MIVWVASGNPQKVRAAQLVFGDIGYEVKSVSVPSHIDQPVGDETLNCAYRRIADVQNAVWIGPKDLVVAFENGLDIIKSPHGKAKWAVDKAFIVIYNEETLNYHVVSSCGVVVDRDFQSVETYSTKYNQQASLDNYFHYTKGANSRVDILREALQLALDTMYEV
jgi:non-canonical (house-cleaning) NTP pyrophosphatase